MSDLSDYLQAHPFGDNQSSIPFAVVPLTAPILPGQAFATFFYNLINAPGNFKNLEMTSFDSTIVTFLDDYVRFNSIGIFEPQTLTFAGNLLPTAAIDRIVAFIAGQTPTEDVSVDLSGGTNGSPTNGGVSTTLWTSWDTVLGGNCYLRFNLHGVLVTFGRFDFAVATPESYDFRGNSLTASEVNAILAKFVSAHLSDGFYANFTGGTNAAPTGQGITDRTNLRNHSWTVLTN